MNDTCIQFITSDLYEILNCFYRVTGLSVGIYDSQNHEISYCDSIQRPYCALIEGTQDGWRNCMYLDENAFEEAMLTRKAISYVCHAGLFETLIPIFVQDLHAGYLVLGQYRLRGQDKHKKVQAVAASYKIDESTLLDAYEHVPTLTAEDVDMYIRLLSVLLDGIISKQYVRFTNADMLNRILTYIKADLSQDLGVDALCKRFCVSHSELYKLFTQIKTTPHEYVKRLRMELASDLLKHTELSIEEISEHVNCSNYTYFIRSFKEYYHISPGKLRRNSYSKSDDSPEIEQKVRI